MNTHNDIDFFLDTSYFLYYTIFGAYSAFKKNTHVTEGNDVDLLQYPEFIDILNHKFTSRFKFIYDGIILPTYEAFDINPEYVDSQNVIAAFDCAKNKIWRIEKHNSYKLQRRVEQPKPFDISKVFEYVCSTLLKSDYVVNESGSRLNLIKVRSSKCEGDDIIATLFKHSNSTVKVIIANDHDYIQLLENSNSTLLVNLNGERITLETVHGGAFDSKEKYLMFKLLFGDSADNIPHILPGFGIKKCIKFANNSSDVIRLIKENAEAAKQLKINSELIDMRKIPTEIQQQILDDYSEVKSQCLISC